MQNRNAGDFNQGLFATQNKAINGMEFKSWCKIISKKNRGDNIL
jgi:hypothetical protein